MTLLQKLELAIEVSAESRRDYDALGVTLRHEVLTDDFQGFKKGDLVWMAFGAHQVGAGVSAERALDGLLDAFAKRLLSIVKDNEDRAKSIQRIADGAKQTLEKIGAAR